MLNYINTLLYNHETVKMMFIFSVVSFFAILLLLPIAIVMIPENYFIHHKRNNSMEKKKNVIFHYLFLIGKNILGAILFIAGLFMFFFPGQGLVTMLVGLMLLNFPGKEKLEFKIIKIPSVLKAINWIRIKADKCVLEVVEPEEFPKS